MGAIEDYKSRNADRDSRRAEKQKPPEKRRWWFDQAIPIDRFTGWLVAWTALLFCATVGNVIVINRTDEKIGKQETDTHDLAIATKNQADISAASERPWVYFTNIKFSDDLTFDPQNGAHIGVSFNLANTGRVPAMKAEVSFNPFILTEGWMDKIKKFEVVGSKGYFGDVVFPGQSPITYGSGGSVPRSEIDEIEKSRSRLFELLMQLCVEYEFPFADTPPDRRHKSCSTIQVTQVNNGQQTLLVIPTPEGSIPKASLFGQFENGGSYAD